MAPDLTPPEVLSIVPADRAVGVSEDVTVMVVFSEPVVIDSLVSAPLRLEDAQGLVDAEATLDSTATILFLTPRTPLPMGIDYRIILAAGITDLSGNVQPDSMVVRFSTGLAFHDIGRIFTANELSRDISVIDALTYEAVDGSPVQLRVPPQRLHGVPEEGALYVLYREAFTAGVLVLDARSLTVLRDTGPVLHADIADLAVSPEDGLLFVASPGENSMLVLDSATLTAVSEPLVFERTDSQPSCIGISRRFRRILIGLDGGARLAAYSLPSLEPVPEFPVPAVQRIHTISIDDERARAWVGGSLRYAVVDLINLSRSSTWQIPAVECNGCTRRLWSLLLSPTYDRVYLMNRRQAVASVVLSTLEPAPESPGGFRFNWFLSAMVQNPRNGDLIVLGWRNYDTPVYRLDGRTLEQIGRILTEVGDKAVDMELMP